MWLKIWRNSSVMEGKPYYDEYENEDDIKEILNYYDDLIEGDGFHALNRENIAW